MVTPTSLIERAHWQNAQSAHRSMVHEAVSIPISTCQHSVRVIVAHPHPLLRSGLSALLRAKQDITIVGEASDEASTLQLISEQKPDVLVLDWDLTHSNDWQILKQISASGIGVRVVLIGVRDDDEDVHFAIQLGAAGILSNETTADSLHDSIQKVSAGQCVLGSVGVESLVGSLRNPKPKSRYQLARHKFGITRREFEVISAIVAGYSNIEIADKFSLSCHTVKHHISHIFDKVGVSNRLELALFAMNHKLMND